MALSMGNVRNTQSALKPHSRVPNQNANIMLRQAASMGDIRSLKTEPIRASDRLRPKAKAISLPASNTVRRRFAHYYENVFENLGTIRRVMPK
jgi:hypothetical protein